MPFALSVVFRGCVQAEQTQHNELQQPVSGVGTVVSGEASESDDEAVHLPLNLHTSLQGIVSNNIALMSQ